MSGVGHWPAPTPEHWLHWCCVLQAYLWEFRTLPSVFWLCTTSRPVGISDVAVSLVAMYYKSTSGNFWRGFQLLWCGPPVKGCGWVGPLFEILFDFVCVLGGGGPICSTVIVIPPEEWWPTLPGLPSLVWFDFYESPKEDLGNQAWEALKWPTWARAKLRSLWLIQLW